MGETVQALKARGHGTLCFYGAPGTGKTALAEHIARSLDKPLLVKQVFLQGSGLGPVRTGKNSVKRV